MYPQELMPVIRKAYEDGLIDPWYIAPEDFEEALELGEDYAYDQIRKDMKRRMPEDVHEYMSWWACFKPDRRPRQSSNISTPPVTVPATPAKKKKPKREKKRKKKMAKASRKKSRR